MRNLLISKPENHNLRRKTPRRIEFSKKEKHSFIADTKLKIGQIRRKMEAKFNKIIFY